MTPSTVCHCCLNLCQGPRGLSHHYFCSRSANVNTAKKANDFLVFCKVSTSQSCEQGLGDPPRIHRPYHTQTSCRRRCIVWYHLQKPKCKKCVLFMDTYIYSKIKMKWKIVATSWRKENEMG